MYIYNQVSYVFQDRDVGIPVDNDLKNNFFYEDIWIWKEFLLNNMLRGPVYDMALLV